MAGTAGFEPTDGGTKNRCLTTWRRPNFARRILGDFCVALRMFRRLRIFNTLPPQHLARLKISSSYLEQIPYNLLL